MEKEKILLLALLLNIPICIKVNFIKYHLKIINLINLLIYNLDCWQYEPNERPNIQDIVSILSSISSESIISSISSESIIDEEYSLSVKSIDIDINADLSITSPMNLMDLK